MKMIKEFKEFAMRGNVVDMAVGIIIGGAFGKIVTSVVGDLLMPVIGFFFGGASFVDLKITLKAFAIFLMIKAMNKMKKKEKEVPAAPAAPPADIALLTEIRDLLKNK